MAINIPVLVYLEPTEQSAVWCAESPAVAGFYAADDDLQTLLTRTERVIEETVGSRDHSIIIDWQLVRPPLLEAPDIVQERADGDDYVAVSTPPRPTVAA